MARLPSPRSLLAVIPCAAIAAMSFAPAANAAGDPVASGHFDLAISPAFKHQLEARRTWVRPQGMSISSGAVDPINGSASLKLNGKVVFRHRHKTLVFGNLSATLGANGVLQGSSLNRGRTQNRSATTLFQLSGGSVARDGFGANVSGVQVSMPPSGGLSRALGVRLPGGTVASLDLTTQPETVAVISGMATVNQDFSPGGTALKLRDHCIDPAAGVSPSGAATQPGGPGTSFSIPVSGGTISPNGWTAGKVGLAGGIDVAVGGPGLPAGCPTSVVATIHFANFAVDIARKSVLTDLSVSGPYSPFGNGVLSVELQGDTSRATMLADPSTHVLTASGAQLGLDQVSVGAMNSLLPHPTGGPSTNFNAGDVLGSANMTVQAR